MSSERIICRVPVRRIKIDLKERSLVLEAEEKPLARLSLAPEGVIFEALAASQESISDQANVLAPQTGGETSTPSQEKAKTIVLSGKLKSLPKEGKPDSRGNPTAYARLAVHDKEKNEPHLYLASFHRHTVKIALGLAREAQIVAEGYPHKADDPQKMDTFSVVNLINYPGKPEKK